MTATNDSGEGRGTNGSPQETTEELFILRRLNRTRME